MRRVAQPWFVLLVSTPSSNDALHNRASSSHLWVYILYGAATIDSCTLEARKETHNYSSTGCNPWCLCSGVDIDLSNVPRWTSRCQGWLWMVQVARWPSVSLHQLWADGPPQDPARLSARSYGSEPSSELMVGRSKSRGGRKCKIYLVLLCTSLWTDAHFHRGPAFRTLKLYLLPPPPLSLSLSLSLYCVSELGVIQDYSLAVSACHMVFDHNFYFPFLEKKLQGNNSPNKNDIDISEKLQDQLHKLLSYNYKNIGHLNE